MFVVKGLFCFLFLIPFFVFSGAGAQEPCPLRITLLTCSPGEELYATFGHTAIRVQDGASGTDEVYNYGTFAFAPDFYIRFIRGKLDYALSVESFRNFLATYQVESRSVVEQDLLLSCSIKMQLWRALQQNATEGARYYRYDFLFDNCTTRARDMIVRYAPQPVLYPNILWPEAPTFRNLLHTYLNRGGQYWSKFGIDLLLGARLDRKVTNEEAMFLPDYLLKAMAGARSAAKPLATKPQTLLAMPSPLNKDSLFRPGIVFTALFLLIGVLSFLKNGFATKAVRVFDFLFFLILGLAGLLLLFMWFGTDHKVCRDNLNLLWALPTHLAGAFFVAKGQHSGEQYFKGIFWANLLLLVFWAFLPQQLALALLPLILLSLLRSGALSKTLSYAATDY